MTVSIKSGRTERLARRAAGRACEGVTGAFTCAREIARRCAALPDLDCRTDEEILGYDERGLFI
jgi:hypothetical protein